MLILPADHTRGEGNITPPAMEELIDDLARLVRWVEADLKALLGVARLAELHDGLGPIVSAITPMTDNKRPQAKGH